MDSAAYEKEITRLRAELQKTKIELKTLREQTKPRKVVHFLHFNDFYNLKPKQPHEFPCGGAPRLADAVHKARAKYPDTITLFSGDFVGPSLASSFTKGRHIIEALDTIGVDFGCLGNHEWDHGWDHLHRHLHGQMTTDGHAIPASRVKWIASNLNGADGNPVMGCSKYEIIVRNGVKIGILGLAEDWVHKLPIEKGKVFYLDVFAEGESLAKMLKTEKECELVIALTHARLPNDYQITSKCPSIDLLLGGHDHFFKMDLEKRIIKSGEEGKYLSIITVELVEGQSPKLSAEIDSIDPTDSEDPQMLKLVSKYEKYIEDKYGQVLCGSDMELNSRETLARFAPSPLGMHMADWVLWSLDYVSDVDDPIDMAFVSGFEAGKGEHLLPAGSDVKVKDLMTFVPNEIGYIAVKITGAQIKQWFENSFKTLSHDGSSECGSFINPSAGVQVKINPSNPLGSRVVDFKFKGQPLDDNKTYVCGGTKWLAKFFPDVTFQIAEEYAVQLNDCVRRALQKLHREGKRLQMPDDCDSRITVLLK